MERMTKASSSTGSSSSGQHHIDAHQRQRERRLKNAPRLVKYAPDKPRPIDGNAGWSRFLAAYRSGRWDMCGRPVDRHEGDDDVTDADLAAATSAMLNVSGPDGQPISGKDYFQQYGHLPAPQMPVRRRKFRHEALLRHGLVSGAFRPQLQRYVELAKYLFDADLVSLSFASADERHIIFIAADGPSLTDVPQCASICSHALLLDGEDEVFVVPDTKQDWRFQNLFGEGGFHTGLTYRFHASAPIYLSSSETPCCNISMAPVHAGRFSIFASKPRENFDVEAGKRLLSLARMVEESMENEFLEGYATQVRQLQLDAAYITQSLEERVERRLKSHSAKQTAALAIASVSDSLAGSQARRSSIEYDTASSVASSAATAAEMVDAAQPAADNSILYDRLAMLPILEMMRQTLNATNVFMLDVSNLRAASKISAPPVDGATASNGKRLSVSANALSDQVVGKRLSTSVQSHSRPSSSSSSSSSSKSSGSGSFPLASDSEANGTASYDRFSPQKKTPTLWTTDYAPFRASESKAGSAPPTPTTSAPLEGASFSVSQPVVSVVASSGENALLPDVEDVTTILSLQAWFDSVSRKANHTTPQLLRRTTLDLSREWVALASDAAPDIDSRRTSMTTGTCPFEIHADRSAGKGACCCAEYVSKENDELLAAIVPMEAQTCLAIAVFGQSAMQDRVPLAMVGVLWDTERPINTSKLEFCKTVGIHLSGVALREQTSKVQRGQMNFIRTMQHELRTPLNGIMGISEALCDTLEESVDDGAASAWSTSAEGAVAANAALASEATPTAATTKTAASPTPKPTSVPAPKPAAQELVRMSTGRRATYNAAQVLAPQLESIHVSSMMLQTILDDILSLDSMFQESSPSATLGGVNMSIHAEVINVAREIEDACREELRYFALQAMRTYRATSEATPMTPSDVQDTPPSTQAKAASSNGGGGSGMTLSPTADLQTANQDTATVMARPPTVLVRNDPFVNRAFRSDRLKLRKIVGKLISNAIRYTSETGSVEVVVSPITAAEADSHAGQAQRQGVPPMSTNGMWSPTDGASTWIRIQVSDTGIGMSEDFIEHKYLQPFLKADQFAQGIGLGATVACVMVQSLGGSFSVQSRVGYGTQVSICLPLGSVSEEEGGGTPTNIVIAPPNSAHDSAPCFRRAQFVGFDIDDGTKALHAFLSAHLRSKNIAIVDSEDGRKGKDEPELLFVHESAVLGTAMTALPSRLGQPNVHSIVVLCNASSLQSDVESVQLIRRGPHAHLKPPFGHDTLIKLDSLLQQFADERPSTDTHGVGAQSDGGTLTPTGRPQKADKVSNAQSNESPGDYFSLGQPSADDTSNNSTAEPTDEEGSSGGATAAAVAAKASPLSGHASESSSASTPNASTSPTTAKQQVTATQAVLQASADNSADGEADRFRVLVVEDNPINMRLITSVLRKNGLKFVEAHDGVEAVAQYKAFEPSVVLLDISLPLMDGFQACVAMRAHLLSFRPKIIAITALSTNEDKARGLNVCGMDAWHTKPISIKMLRTNLVTWKSEWDASRNSAAAKSPEVGSPAMAGTPTTEQMELTLPNGAVSLPSSLSKQEGVNVK